MAATGDPSYRSDGSRRSRTGGYHSRPGPTRQKREASWPSDAEFERGEQRERDEWNSKYGGRNKWKGVTLPTGVKPHHMESRDRHGNEIWPPVDPNTQYRHGYKKTPPELSGRQWNKKFHGKIPSIQLSKKDGETRVQEEYLPFDDFPWGILIDQNTGRVHPEASELWKWRIGQGMERFNKTLNTLNPQPPPPQ